MVESGCDEGDWDVSSTKEEEFERHVVYIVPDQPAPQGTTNRAEASLPRNLVLRPSRALSDVRKYFLIFLHYFTYQKSKEKQKGIFYH